MLLCSSCSGNLLSSIVSPKLRQRLIRVSESQLHHHQQHKIKMERKESGNDSDAFGFKFLTKTSYAPPSWASHLAPIPSHVFSLGHRDDLSGMQLSGNKVRKLEFLMADAVAQGADCIITIGGIQSNHCRAAAVAAKYLNLDCYLILRTSKVLVDQDPGLIGNLLVERLVGAHIELISKEEYSKIGSVTLTNILKEKLLKEGRRPYVIPVGGSNSIGTWGYIEAIKEIEQQLQTGTGGVKFDDIVVACGSGGTIAGLSLGSWLGTLKAKVGSLKSTIDERFNTVQQQFSSLEVMLLKLTELHLKPPLATSTDHDGVPGEGFDGTEPVVGGDAEGEGPKTTNLAQLGVMGHDRFGGGVVGPGDSWPRGAFPGLGQGRGSWVTAGGGGVFGERGSGYDRNVAGQGISAQYRARQGEFWAGSSGYAETGVDSRGWRPPMGRALFRLQWTLKKGKTDGSGIIFGGKGPCVVSMARTMTTIEVRTVMEYREKFELLSRRLGGNPKAVLEGNFMKGLKPEIRASLHLIRPRGLGESMELAQMIEDKNTAELSTPLGGQKMQMMGLPRDFQRDQVSGAQPGVTFKHFTETEIQDKRAKGLCLQCGEKISPGHRCKDKSLQVLTVCDEEEGGEEAEEEETIVF
ncbi:putative D-cysteine desulfhydrase 1 [Citrus sinensis]|uniref:D-cysteine desulfhydrase 1 n=1 Tax=Citrus sinensis TaxID=2711 RepID=A0ACB8M5T0_CITSI|nr:putative D-cysteine desulfhydrase 1 [Citrus sinensis]